MDFTVSLYCKEDRTEVCGMDQSSQSATTCASVPSDGHTGALWAPQQSGS